MMTSGGTEELGSKPAPVPLNTPRIPLEVPRVEPAACEFTV